MSSYYTELDADYGSELESWESEQYRLIDKGLWEMKNGQIIPISKMTNSHLHNTIRMIRRNMYNGYYEEHGMLEVRSEQLEMLEEEKRTRRNK